MLFAYMMQLAIKTCSKNMYANIFYVPLFKIRLS